LRTATARNKPNRDLWLREKRFVQGSKAHVHSQSDLTSSSPSPSFDFCDGYLRHVPEPFADHLCKAKAAGMGHSFGCGSNPPQSRVGYKEIGKFALQDHDPDAVIDLELFAKLIEFQRQHFIKKIYRWVINADECNSRIKPEIETFVIRISHDTGSILVTVSENHFGMVYVLVLVKLRRYANSPDSKPMPKPLDAEIGCALASLKMVTVASAPGTTSHVRVPEALGSFTHPLLGLPSYLSLPQ
jgi:hypothetical protein